MAMASAERVDPPARFNYPAAFQAIVGDDGFGTKVSAVERGIISSQRGSGCAQTVGKYYAGIDGALSVRDLGSAATDP
jgi:hypothetical protein